jgi:aryl-alcohol dehydrogenase-like predicted oxidoreductase
VLRRDFGKTGIRVSVLGLGGSEIGAARTSQRDVNRIVGAALEAGINVIDTAECYGDSEDKIGRAVGHRRDSCYLFTKCGHPGGVWNRLRFSAWDAKLLRSTIDRSLKRLRTDHLDLLQLHGCPEMILRRGDVIHVLAKAKQAGKVRFIGYSGDDGAALYAVKCEAFDALQVSVNIADQTAIAKVLPVAGEYQLGVIAKRPIANVSWLTNYVGTYSRRLNRLRYDFLKLPVAQSAAFALRFTLTCPGVHTAIVGTTKPDHILKNTNSLDADGLLSMEEFATIRERWARVAEPSWTGQA